MQSWFQDNTDYNGFGVQHFHQYQGDEFPKVSKYLKRKYQDVVSAFSTPHTVPVDSDLLKEFLTKCNTTLQRPPLEHRFLNSDVHWLYEQLQTKGELSKLTRPPLNPSVPDFLNLIDLLQRTKENIQKCSQEDTKKVQDVFSEIVADIREFQQIFPLQWIITNADTCVAIYNTFTDSAKQSLKMIKEGQEILLDVSDIQNSLTPILNSIDPLIQSLENIVNAPK